jgi:ion channel
MLNQLLAGGLVSILNFGVHALMTGVVIVITRHIAGATDDLHVFMRVSALMLVTVTVLTVTHVIEIAIWAVFLHVAGISAEHVSVFEFAFENYTALGYGDVVAADGWRLIGPIMALNGLLLIGWSVAIIFEVMRMAEVGFSKRR